MEVFHAAPLVVDELTKFGALVWVGATAYIDRGKRVPEELMVQVTATVEFDPREAREVSWPIIVRQGFFSIFLQFIQVFHIGPVMHAVVEIQHLMADDWL